jgi:hypothetical protein
MPMIAGKMKPLDVALERNNEIGLLVAAKV